MKITAGMGSIDEYIPYVQAGADEVFCGFMPADWMLDYGLSLSINRREVRYCNVQLGSFSELEILSAMQEAYGVPVILTFNSLYYLPEQYSRLADIMAQTASIGLDRFIIADPALLLYLHRQGLTEKYHIHISGEMGEYNTENICYLQKLGANRIIFHRKNTLGEMRSCIANTRKLPGGGDCQYEAFTLNEMCHFHGAYCNTLHCDELCHACLMPWNLSPVENRQGDTHSDMSAGVIEPQRNFSKPEEEPQSNFAMPAEEPQSNFVMPLKETENAITLPMENTEKETFAKHEILQQADEDISASVYLPGATGCALCFLWDFRQIGITHLKLVSRGNYAEDTVADIRSLKSALQILEKASCKEEYLKAMKQELFPYGCSNNCYLPK